MARGGSPVNSSIWLGAVLLSSISGLGDIFGLLWWLKWQKGSTISNKKNSYTVIFLWKTLKTFVFKFIQIRLRYYLDLLKKNYSLKSLFLKIAVVPQSFPAFQPQICQLNFFIIWQLSQIPNAFFCLQMSSTMAQLGTNRFWGPSNKTLSFLKWAKSNTFGKIC